MEAVTRVSHKPSRLENKESNWQTTQMTALQTKPPQRRRLLEHTSDVTIRGHRTGQLRTEEKKAGPSCVTKKKRKIKRVKIDSCCFFFFTLSTGHGNAGCPSGKKTKFVVTTCLQTATQARSPTAPRNRRTCRAGHGDADLFRTTVCVVCAFP